mgnify:CR=1 FL=1
MRNSKEFLELQKAIKSLLIELSEPVWQYIIGRWNKYVESLGAEEGEMTTDEENRMVLFNSLYIVYRERWDNHITSDECNQLINGLLNTYLAAYQPPAEQEKSMEDIDLKTAAVNYVTEKHNKQAGDVWYDENESDAQSFIAGFQYAALQTASLTRQTEELRKALGEIVEQYPDSERDGKPIIALNNIREIAYKHLDK